MDIRLLIVASPFIIAFLYTFFWLNKWGAFSRKSLREQKKIMIEEKTFEDKFSIENIFLIKD